MSQTRFVPPPAPEVPVDADGFVETFDASDAAGVRTFFETYGFVAVRNVLTDDRCRATIDGLIRRAEAVGLDRDDLDSMKAWFEDQRFGRFGIMGTFPDVLDLEQLRNRCAPEVYRGFVAVLGQRALWVDHDRLGIMPPTLTADGEPSGYKATVERWLHLDCNPLSGPRPGTGYASIASLEDDGSPVDFHRTLIIQGLLTLTDAPVEDGGFHCVPGSHKYCHDWVRDRQGIDGMTTSNIQVPPDDEVRGGLTKVAVRQGCLLAWTSLLFHGNHPNRSDRMRAVQYIRMVPTTGTPYRPLLRSPESLPPEFERTPLADRLLGFEAWG